MSTVGAPSATAIAVEPPRWFWPPATATTVWLMSSTKEIQTALGATRALAVAALCEHSAYRNIVIDRLSRSVTALREILADATAGHAAPAAQDHLRLYVLEVQAHFNVNEAAAVQLAAEQLAETWLGQPTKRIDDVPRFYGDIVAFLASLERWCLHERSPQLFTSTRLAQLADLAPGGLDVYKRRSPSAIRTHLANEYETDPRLLGHPLVHNSGILDASHTALHSGPGARALYALNEMLCDFDAGEHRRALVRSVMSFFEETATATEKSRRSKIIEELNPLSRPEVIVAPKFQTTLSRLASAKATEDELRQTLTWAFWSELSDADPCYQVFQDIQRGFYEKLISEMDLVSHDADPRTNLRRLTELLNLDPGEMSALHKFDFVAGLVDLSSVPPPTDGRVTSRFRAPQQVDAAVVLEVLSEIHHSVGHELHLPSPGSLHSAMKTYVRKRTGVEYADLFAQRTDYGYCGDDSGSSYEKYFRDNVAVPLANTFTEAIGNRGYRDLKSKNDVAQRPDFVMRLANSDVPTVILAEMQGQQHFTDGRIGPMDGRQSRESDVHKYDQVRAMAQADDERVVLVALHHRLLTPSYHKRLLSDQFTQLVQTATETNAWWMYVRPKGYADMNAVPTGMSPEKLTARNLPPSLAHLDVFVIRTR